ncbi:prolyl endopeptidase-like [Venturia canescens]|uniref:prolyl endopeptidase-like n=1 Tax=Venturia canescens TaxID=32260 RepID=UPI001C9C72A6|nr:prolyl endopeptidase-like [Venturia canescens]
MSDKRSFKIPEKRCDHRVGELYKNRLSCYVTIIRKFIVFRIVFVISFHRVSKMKIFRYKIVWTAIFVMTGAFPHSGPILEKHRIVKKSVLRTKPRLDAMIYGKVAQKIRRMNDVYDQYYEYEIQNAYKRLENLNAADTKVFVEEQNKLTETFLSNCTFREKIKNKVEDLWRYETQTCPAKYDNKYYYETSDGRKDEKVLYYVDTLGGSPSVFSFPNTDPNRIVTHKKFSGNGKILAYSVSTNGESSDTDIYFKDVTNNTLLPKSLSKVKYSTIAWTKDNGGIFYVSYTEGDADTRRGIQKLHLHRLEQEQNDDTIVQEFKDEPFFQIDAEVTDNGEWLLFTVTENVRDKSVYAAKISPDGKLVGHVTEIVKKTEHVGLHLNLDATKLLPTNKNTTIDKFDTIFEYVANDGPEAIFLTSRNSQNFSLIKINLNNPGADWSVLLPEDKNFKILQWAKAVNGDHFVACYLDDVSNVLQLHDLKNGEYLKTFTVPRYSTVSEFSGSRSRSEIFYKVTSFLIPGDIYKADLTDPRNPKVTIHYKTTVPGFDSKDYKVRQDFYQSSSHNTTKIPIFIVSKKDRAKKESMPALLYGNGGFGVSIQPHFSVSRLVFMKNFNGIFAIANIRGGGEYGEKWHDEGRLFKKQNSFNDFQDAARYLVNKEYTTAGQLAIHGVGNGGLLVAVCINQKPELFGAAIAESGFMDMLRYHNFGSGYSLIPEYGKWEVEQQFYNLLRYSPLHNIKRPPSYVPFPATLLLTEDHDECISPMHTYKYIASLQYRNGLFGGNGKNCPPLMARIELESGHGIDESNDKGIKKYADILTFITYSLGLNFED